MQTYSIPAIRRLLTGTLAAGALAAALLPAHAGEVYGKAGLPGMMLGYAEPVSDAITLRADVSTLGIIEVDGRKDGVDYTGKVKLNRAGVFGDWFVFGPGGFRLTGGATYNDVRVDWKAQGNGQLVTLGDDLYLLTSADRINVHVAYPRLTPYLGIGWGSQPSGGPGWGFVFDLGASIGRAKVSGQASGPALSSPVGQQDFQRELDDLRNRVDKWPFVPQLSAGASYRF